MVSSLKIILAGTIGSIGFALVFHAKGKVLLVGGIGGMLCGIIYVICERELLYSGFISALISAACIAAYSEFAARIIKEPAIVLFVPSIISLMPGSSLYYTLSAAVNGDWILAEKYAIELATVAFGIALGACIIWTILEICNRVKKSLMTDK
jgi:uncharacterized membrane protein YjjB (DUF3815 family)